MARFGHFGTPALVIALTAVVALIVHLAVPYAHVSDAADGQPITQEHGNTVSRGEAAEVHEDYGLVGPSSPGVTLAGVIVLLAAGLTLLVAGFLPLTTAPARWIGWAGGLAGVVGALLAFTSSLFWVGAGFGQYPYGAADLGGFGFGGFAFGFGSFAVGGLTGGLSGLLELMWKTDNAGTVWVIGPVLTSALAAVSFVAATRLCSDVVSVENGTRDRARLHLGAARWAFAALGLAIALPWGVGQAQDYDGEGDEDMFAFGAHTILNVDDVTDGDIYGTAATGLTLLLVAGWVGVLGGTVASLGGVIASTGGPAALARAFHFTAAATALAALLGVAGFFTAFGGSWEPFDGAERFQPAWVNLLVLGCLAVWTTRHVPLLRNLAARQAGSSGKGAPAPVSFE